MVGNEADDAILVPERSAVRVSAIVHDSCPEERGHDLVSCPDYFPSHKAVVGETGVLPEATGTSQLPVAHDPVLVMPS